MAPVRSHCTLLGSQFLFLKVCLLGVKLIVQLLKHFYDASRLIFIRVCFRGFNIQSRCLLQERCQNTLWSSRNKLQATDLNERRLNKASLFTVVGLLLQDVDSALNGINRPRESFPTSMKRQFLQSKLSKPPVGIDLALALASWAMGWDSNPGQSLEFLEFCAPSKNQENCPPPNASFHKGDSGS